MHLNLNDLYTVLTDQGLVATDRICSLLSQNRDSPWYDEFFQTSVNALKPIVMCDHEIGIEARQKLICGVVERVGLGEDILQQVGQTFAEFSKKASLEFREVFQNIQDNQLLAHIYTVTPHTNLSFFCDYWPELSAYERAFKILIEAEHELTLHSIRTQNEKKKWPAVDATASKDYAMARIVERIEYATIPNLQKTRQALDILQDHPNFLSFVNHLLSTHHQDYDKHTRKGHKLFNLENQLPTHLRKRIDRVHAETLELVKEFQPLQFNLISQLWANKVAQRCRNLLEHMKNAPEDVYPIVVVNKSSIEERRAKDDNSAVHGTVLKS